jgi:hypothetical protein
MAFEFLLQNLLYVTNCVLLMVRVVAFVLSFDWDAVMVVILFSAVIVYV